MTLRGAGQASFYDTLHARDAPVPVLTSHMLHVAINLSPARQSISGLRWFYRAGLKMWRLLVWRPLESEFHSPAGCNIFQINWWGRIVPNDNIKHAFIQLVTHNCLFKLLKKKFSFSVSVVSHPSHCSLNCSSQWSLKKKKVPTAFQLSNYQPWVEFSKNSLKLEAGNDILCLNCDMLSYSLKNHHANKQKWLQGEEHSPLSSTLLYFLYIGNTRPIYRFCAERASWQICCAVSVCSKSSSTDTANIS